MVIMGPSLNRTFTDSDPAQYSLASAFSLTNYDRVMVLPTPGLVLKTRPLDSVLAFSEPEPISSYPQMDTAPSILLIKPLADTFNKLTTLRRKASQPDSELLRKAFPSPAALLSDADPDFHPSMYTTLAELRTPRAESTPFNATEFLDSTAFVHLIDDELPSPQYDVPYSSIVKLRPGDQDQGFLWEKMYSMYKDRRYGVCGLDLEPWPPGRRVVVPEANEDL
jgi:hypothetical protein